jgi:hypothetical protein
VELRVPELTRVGSLYLDSNLELVSSEFPKLEIVTDTLFVNRNIKLVSWGLDALHMVESVEITANPALPLCLVDALNADTGHMASSELTGTSAPPNCDCPTECGRIAVVCN